MNNNGPKCCAAFRETSLTMVQKKVHLTNITPRGGHRIEISKSLAKANHSPILQLGVFKKTLIITMNTVIEK